MIIDEIKSRLSMRDIVTALGIEVNRSGFAHSIYKREKTPSLKFNFAENYFKDFSTGEGGDQIKFYQDFYKLDMDQTIKDLIKLARIEPGKFEKRENIAVEEKKENRSGLINALSKPELQLYESILSSKGEEEAVRVIRLNRMEMNSVIYNDLYNYCTARPNKKAIAYLNNRGLSDVTINRFKIFTIDNYFEVNNHLKKEFSNSELTRAGLISDKGNLIFFNHRIMIPYLYKNTIVYLRGRYFDQDNQTVKEAMMKYLGIKNDAVNVNGSRRFYNIDTLKSCHEGRELYITEGEFDTMMIEQNMFPSVAIPGAGNTPNEGQLNKLLPYKLLVVADNDEAGMRLLQGLKLHFSKHNKIINRVELPSNSKDVSDWYMAG